MLPQKVDNSDMNPIKNLLIINIAPKNNKY